MDFVLDTIESFFDITFVAWKPEIADSIDGAPLATKISDLLWDFPYDRLSENRLLANHMRPEVMLVGIALYLTSKGPIQGMRDQFGITGKSDVFKLLLALHSATMQTLSAVVAINVWSTVITHYQEHGMEATYCDRDGTLWASGFGAWSTIFYLFSYYQFIDMWILLLKGKETPDLQVYLHAGTVFTMWGGIVSQSAWLHSIVMLNSAFHCIMYTYSFMMTMFPTIYFNSARYLPTMQIVILIEGIVYTLATHGMGSACDSQSSRFMLAIIQLAAAALIAIAMTASKKAKSKTD
jgi:hypothetical protein